MFNRRSVEQEQLNLAGVTCSNGTREKYEKTGEKVCKLIEGIKLDKAEKICSKEGEIFENYLVGQSRFSNACKYALNETISSEMYKEQDKVVSFINRHFGEQAPEILRECYERRLCLALVDGKLEDVSKIKELIRGAGLPDDKILLNVARDSIYTLTAWGGARSIPKVVSCVTRLGVNEAILNILGDGLVDCCKKGFIRSLSYREKGEAQAIENVMETYGLGSRVQEVLFAACKDGMQANVKYDNRGMAESMMHYYEEKYSGDTEGINKLSSILGQS